MLRKVIKLLILVAAVGGPILYYKAPHIWASVKKTCSSAFGGGEEKEDSTPLENLDSPLEVTPLGTPKVPVHEGVVTDLSEVFRFDGVSIDWIMNRWPRATTGLSQLQYQGYRVPLVTGTRLNDLAGSLTYYFYFNQQVQTITFNGTTGDPSRLLQMLTQKYGFQRQLANDAGLFVYVVPSEKGKVQSMLRIRPARILRTDSLHTRYKVDMILQRPNNKNEKVATKQTVPNWKK